MHEAKGLNLLAKERTPKINHKSDEQKELRVKKEVRRLNSAYNSCSYYIFLLNHNNKVDHTKTNNRFNVFADNAVIEEKDGDEMEKYNDKFKMTK